MRRGRGEVAPSPTDEPSVPDIGVKASKFKSALQKIGATLNKPRASYQKNAARFSRRKGASY